MRVLFDTHLVLWAALSPSRLPQKVLAFRYDERTELMCSVVCIWEVAIKAARGKADFAVDAAILRSGVIERGWTELPVTSEHAIVAGALPPIHKDPFDRMLVAQATVEGALLLTSDPVVARYPGPVRLV